MESTALISKIKDETKRFLATIEALEGAGDKDIVHDMVSPFTGGLVAKKRKFTTVTFRGEEFTVEHEYYKCLDTGREFVDSKLEDNFLWAVFRAYCDKHYDTFTEILEKEIAEH